MTSTTLAFGLEDAVAIFLGLRFLKSWYLGPLYIQIITAVHSYEEVLRTVLIVGLSLELLGSRSRQT